METLLQDIRFGFRTLSKSPGYTAIAIVALALGIGANTAIFSIADAFLFKPLNLPDPGHVVIVEEQSPAQTDNASAVAPANFADWRQQAKSFSALGAFEWDDINLTGTGLPEKVQGFAVTANFFQICNVQPMLGRTFVDGEDQPGHDGVTVLSQNLWQRQFGGDPRIVGQTVHLEGRPYTVIGVMPKSFNFPMSVELWVPLALTPEQRQSRSSHQFEGIARLKDDVAAQSANAEMHTIARRLSDEYPTTNRGWRAVVTPIHKWVVGNDTISYTYMLMGAVIFVLLIVCANVANLQLVRGASRQKEIAIRGALGGSRMRVVRQLITESTLLAMGGALLGLVFAKWSLSMVLSHMPASVAKYIAGWDQIHLDLRALLFTILAAAIAGVVAGILPAFETTRVDLNEVLKEGGRSGSSARGRHVLRDALVVTQITLSVVLLAGAGLIVRGFKSLLSLDTVYQPETMLTLQINLPDVKYPDATHRAAFYDQLLQNLAAVPGAQGAAYAQAIPLDDNTASRQAFTIENRPWRDTSEAPIVDSENISPSYFRLLHVPVIRGREFTADDSTNTQQVAIISRSLEQKYFPNGDAIGHRLRAGLDGKNPWMTIVGVVADVKSDWGHIGPDLAFYRPYRQAPRGFTIAFLRATGDPMALAAGARAAIAAVDKDEPAYEVKPMSQAVMDSMIGLAYVAVMMGVLGIIALVLAAVGVYGVMAFTVEQRTYEIGIRMALGAQRSDVMHLVLRSGLLLTAIGLFIGLPLALGTARLLTNLIYGIGASDPATFAEIGVLLIVVATAACWVPTQRAIRTDPIVALRYE
jgi:putative ABC transport system permease protein